MNKLVLGRVFSLFPVKNLRLRTHRSVEEGMCAFTFHSRSPAAPLSWFLRFSVVALSFHCRGSLVPLSWLSRSTVVALSFHYRGSLVPLSWLSSSNVVDVSF